MADPDRDDIATPQREVQRLRGRCLIRIQQYERLLKAICALQEISGSTQTLPHAIGARRAETSDETLGTLIGRLLGGYIIPVGVEPSSGDEDSVEGSAHFNLRMHLSLPRDAYETLKVDLREMVTLRNTLVHHFIDQYDLWAVDGCLRAQDAMNSTYAEIDRQLDPLHARSEEQTTEPQSL